MPATLSCNGCNIITKGSSSDSSGAFKQLRRKYKRLPFTWLKRKSICSVVITIFFTIPLSLRDCKPKQGRKNKEKKKSSRKSVDFDISGFIDPFARYDTLRTTRLPLSAAFSCVTYLPFCSQATEKWWARSAGRSTAAEARWRVQDKASSDHAQIAASCCIKGWVNATSRLKSL